MLCIYPAKFRLIKFCFNLTLKEDSSIIKVKVRVEVKLYLFSTRKHTC